MKFEGDIENSFAKAIRNDSFSVNYQALTMATNAKAEGSDFDFIKVIEENEITERLEDFLCFAPIEDEANFELYQGGRRACNALCEVFAAKPKEQGNDLWLTTEEKSEILPRLDRYMSSISGVEGNEKSRLEINISKTQYELYQKMLHADVFDVSLALSIHKMNCVIDKLSPEFVKNHMTHEDVKAIVVMLDPSIDEDIVYGDLSHEVSRFVKSCRLSTKKPHVLFGIMTTFANALANGETEEEVLRSLREIGLVEEKVIQKYCVAVEEKKAKATDEVEEQELVVKAFIPLSERLEQSVLSIEEQKYFKSLLDSGTATAQDVEYINEMIEQTSITDEEIRLMEEFDREYDDEVAGIKRKRFGFGR